mgnify:FL=1
MAMTEVVESKKKKLHVRKIFMWAFVMPVYDLGIMNLHPIQFGYIPRTEKYAVGYHVYGWEYGKQRWKLIDLCSSYEEGVDVAQKYHDKMLKKYQISSE